MSFFGDLGHTLKALGGAVYAPVGATWDLATFAARGKSLGEGLSEAAGELGRLKEPFTNKGTFTGDASNFVWKEALHPVMDGMAAVYRPVDETIGAATTMASHIDAANHGNLIASGWGEMFSGSAWGKAFAIAKTENHNDRFGAIGSSWATMALSDYHVDPFDYADPFKQKTEVDNPVLANVIGGVSSLGISWFLDPTVIVGKAGGALRQSEGLGHVIPKDAGDVGSRMGITDNKVPGLPTYEHPASGPFHGTRIDKWQAMIEGANSTKRPLGAYQIAQITPELNKAGNGMAYAFGKLMVDARKVGTSPEDVANIQKRLLAVGLGDETQAARLLVENQHAASIVDALNNIKQGGPLSLLQQALDPIAQYDPAGFADATRQLENIDAADSGAVSRFVTDFTKRVSTREQMNSGALGAKGQLQYIPGVHPASSALRRTQGTRLSDKIAEAHANIEQKVLDKAHEPASGVFQKSLQHVPLVAVKTANIGISPWTKGIRGATDALRQTHFTGTIDFNNWGDAMDQFDSYLRLGKVPAQDRVDILNKAANALHEPDKLAAREAVENAGLKGLAAWAAAKHGKEISPEYIKSAVAELRRRQYLQVSAMRGSQYSAAALPENLIPNDARSVMNAADPEEAAKALAESSDFYKQPMNPDELSTWRVDQKLDHGQLVTLPLDAGTLANKMPMMDIGYARHALSQKVHFDQLHAHGQAFDDEATRVAGLRAKLARTGGKSTRLIEQLYDSSQRLDSLVQYSGTLLNKLWKFEVLFRLGYPARVVTEDTMRIAASTGLASHVGRNVGESFSNFFYNHMPDIAHLPGGDRMELAKRTWKSYQQERDELENVRGLKDITQSDIRKVEKAQRVYYDETATEGDRSTAHATMMRLDPEGRISEYYNQADQVVAKQAEGDQESAQALLDRMPSNSPLEQLARLEELQATLRAGAKPLREEKRVLGKRDVKIKLPRSIAGDDNFVLAHGGTYGPQGEAIRREVGADVSSGFGGNDEVGAAEARLADGGAYETVMPEENPKRHLMFWVNNLNHQTRNSPGMMFFVEHPDASVEDFVNWIHKPEQATLRLRNRSYSQDPENWGGRLKADVDHNVPTAELRAKLAEGPVTESWLNNHIPVSERPPVHGQSTDIQSGRNPAVRAMDHFTSKVFHAIGAMPSDQLSRHPFYNTMYRKEIKRLVQTKAHALAKDGKKVTNLDLEDAENTARVLALAHVKRTLWDISGHSHAGHVLRFISPFFVAHQEALSRWYRLASEDPSVLAHYQMAYDDLASTGLVTDQNGDPVKPHEGFLGAGNKVALRMPGPINSGLNKWIAKMGGDQFFSINESGLDVIMQSGPLNPGTGPLVNIPVEALARHYADIPRITKIASALNPYPQQSLIAPAQAASLQKLIAIVHGDKNAMFAAAVNSNYNQLVTDFKLRNDGRQPNPAEFEALMQTAHDRATRDMWFRFASNMVAYTPVAPMGKYAVITDGWHRLLNQADKQGKDYDWAIEQFNAKYGDIYDALISSATSNPGRYEGTPGEVWAVKQHESLLRRLADPSIARIVIGPAAAAEAAVSPAMGQRNDRARLWLTQSTATPGGTDTILGTKSPRDRALAEMVQEGWTKFDQLNSALTVAAKQAGLQSYTDSPQLKQYRDSQVANLIDENPAWASSFNPSIKNAYPGTKDSSVAFDTKLMAMKQVATNYKLLHDTTRQDVVVLGKYLQLRDAVAAQLAAQKARGLSTSADSPDNAGIIGYYVQELNKLRASNLMFDTYAYNGIIEFDPLLRSAPGLNPTIGGN